MDESIARLRERHPEIGVERANRTFAAGDDGQERTRVYCVVSGLAGNPDLEIILPETEDLARLEELLDAGLLVLRDIAGCRLDAQVHVLLSHITWSAHISRMLQRDQISITTQYFRHTVNVTILRQSGNTPFLFLVDHARQLRRRPTSAWVATMTGLSQVTESSLEAHVRNILNSVLFDLEFTYGLGLETVSFDSLQAPRRRQVKSFARLPEAPIPMVYKDYVPELLEYYHAGERVDYLPFRYICYFHVLEYFSDKSAHYVVSGEIRSMLLMPDFHQNVDAYVSRAIQVIKKESERSTTDKVKLNRVLRQFVTMEEVRGFLDNPVLTDHFAQDCSMQCAKLLVLPALDYSSENQFFDSLTKRIYSLRCSIVHSNPDSEDSRAIPFVPTGENLEALWNEIWLLAEISRVVIVKSARN